MPAAIESHLQATERDDRHHATDGMPASASHTHAFGWSMITLLLPIGVVACSPRSAPALAQSPCPQWERASRGQSPRGEIVLFSPKPSDLRDREYVVVTDSALPRLGCFADSLTRSVGARAGWVNQSLRAFTVLDLSDSGARRIRATPHVIDVHRSVKFRIRDSIRIVPDSSTKPKR